MMIKTFALFVATALAEITGCYLPWLWLRKGGSVWLLVPACLSLAVFAWLLDPAPRSQWQSIRRLWLRIRGYSPLVAAPCRWCTAGQHRYLGRCCGSGGYGHYCLRLGNRCIKARAIRRQCKQPGVKPGFCIGGGSVVLEAWRHLPTREMPPCVRMHAYMLSPVLMR